MPRHRIEAPRQRTLWPAAVQSARRVPSRAAGRQHGKPGHAKPAVAPEWRHRLIRSQRRMLKQAGRRLLVSPWFAAGAGFVIATGAVIYMPHSQLDPAINITHCKGASCEPTQLTPQIGAKPLPVGTGAPIPVPSPSLPAGMTFWYQPGHSAQGEFSMWIEIRARDSLGQWQLSFHVPGATSIWVYWPRWQPSGIDGVTVSSYYAGTESAGYAQISAHEAGSAGELSRGGYTVLFQIRGTGTPGPPTHCTYNGATCQFKPSGGLSSAAWPGFG